jgi:hypothetical protein
LPLAPEPWGVHVSQRNRNSTRLRASPRLVELPDLASTYANCTAVATKRALLHSPAGKMHAQDRGSLATAIASATRDALGYMDDIRVV